MRYILDASFFFGDFQLEGELWTTEEVDGEVRDTVSRMRFELAIENGLAIGAGAAADKKAAHLAAVGSGDDRVLSQTDLSVIALAHALNGTVVSDDFAVQNVCRHLNIPTRSLMQKTAEKRVWKRICSGCGAEIPDGESDCPICGSPPKMRGTERAKAEAAREKNKKNPGKKTGRK